MAPWGLAFCGFPYPLMQRTTAWTWDAQIKKKKKRNLVNKRKSHCFHKSVCVSLEHAQAILIIIREPRMCCIYSLGPRVVRLSHYYPWGFLWMSNPSEFAMIWTSLLLIIAGEGWVGQREGMTLVLLKVPHSLCLGIPQKSKPRKDKGRQDKQEDSPQHLGVLKCAVIW